MQAGQTFNVPCAIRVLGVAFSCLVASGCASQKETFQPLETVPYEVEPWSYQQRAAQVLKTEHYRIYTTLRDQRLLESLPQMMESAFAFFQYLIPAAHEPAAPMEVYLFAGRDDWADFTRRFTGPRARKFLQLRRGGYSVRGVSVIEFGGYQTTFPIMVHEGMHQYLTHCIQTRVPAWLNEGLAAFCEGQRWGDAGLESFDPWHNPARRNALAEALVRGELFPLAELLRMDAGHVVGGPNRRIGTYYSQVWALMLFLRDGAEGKYAERFQRLLELLGTGGVEQYIQAALVRSRDGRVNQGEALFRGLITDDLETFQSEFEQFIRAEVIGGRRRSILGW